MATRPRSHHYFSQIAALVVVVCAIALAACTGMKKQDDTGTTGTQSPSQSAPPSMPGGY